jgi:uncharacterized protein (TIGR02996 family)
MNPYAHPDWNAFLLKIAAAPHDDLPRLVAADWLEDRGEPQRAELIRLQCELEHPERHSPQVLRELRWHERRLWNMPTGGPLWACEACPNIVQFDFSQPWHSLGGLGITGHERVQFRRGFPELLNCSAPEWRAFGHRIVPRQPLGQLVLTQVDELPPEEWWNLLPTLRHLRAIKLVQPSLRISEWLALQLPNLAISSSPDSRHHSTRQLRANDNSSTQFPF